MGLLGLALCVSGDDMLLSGRFPVGLCSRSTVIFTEYLVWGGWNVKPYFGLDGKKRQRQLMFREFTYVQVRPSTSKHALL